jgi:glutathione S-transferase
LAQHQLIGAMVSLYTGKVRAYLDYKGIPYTEVAARREIYRDVIVPRTGVRFIPVLISDDDIAVQDSTAIIDFLEQRHPQPSVYPSGPLQRWVALLLETYADEWLVIPAMHYRWNVPENRAFAMFEFGRLSAPDATEAEQREIGERLAGPFAGALPALGVHPHSVTAIEQSYLSFLADFDRHLAEHPYLLGARPCIGDFALFGPLFAHLYRDPASGRLMRERAPRVAEWVTRMRDGKPAPGDFVAEDAIPETLHPLLARLFRELAPVLESTAQALEAVDLKRAEAPLPRALGTHSFRLGEVTSERAIYPANLWRWQRAADHYQAFDPAARARADALLGHTSPSDPTWIKQPLRRRLARKNNRLYIET